MHAGYQGNSRTCSNAMFVDHWDMARGEVLDSKFVTHSNV